jgi:hypothetical protein
MPVYANGSMECSASASLASIELAAKASMEIAVKTASRMSKFASVGKVQLRPFSLSV